MTTLRSLVARPLRVAAAFALAGLATSAAHAANIAVGRAVVPSGPTWPGLNGFHLTDDDLNTIAHASGQVTSYGYIIDLGQTANVSQIDIANRNNCCSERLTNYRVSLLNRAPGGGPGNVVFTTDLRTDYSNSGLGGIDSVPGVNASGRYVQVEKIDDGVVDYYLQAAEVMVEGFLPEQNVAYGKPVYSSADTWAGFPPSNITDGFAGTITHPLAGDAGPFSFDIDLGEQFALDRIHLYNRGDSCCSDRLSNYAVSLLSDAGGAPGAVLWTATVRGDGSNSGNAGLDELFAADGTGTFAGRWLRVESDGVQYGPQISEVEAYAVPEPATGLTLAAGALALLRRPRR
jgi:hypothetical protein